MNDYRILCYDAEQNECADLSFDTLNEATRARIVALKKYPRVVVEQMKGGEIR